MLNNMPYTNLSFMIKEIEDATEVILTKNGYDDKYKQQFLHELMIKLYDIEDKVKGKFKGFHY